MQPCSVHLKTWGAGNEINRVSPSLRGCCPSSGCGAGGVAGVRGVGTGIPLLRRLAAGAPSLAIVTVHQVVPGLAIVLWHMMKAAEKQRKQC